MLLLVPMAEAGGVRVMAMGLALALTGMTWGEPGALSVTVMVSESGPEATGAKVTVMVHVPMGAMEPEQALELVKSAVLAPPKATEEMERAAVPELVITTGVGALVAPWEMAAKVSGLGAAVNAGVGEMAGLLEQPAIKRRREETHRQRERIPKRRFLDTRVILRERVWREPGPRSFLTQNGGKVPGQF